MRCLLITGSRMWETSVWLLSLTEARIEICRLSLIYSAFFPPEALKCFCFIFHLCMLVLNIVTLVPLCIQELCWFTLLYISFILMPYLEHCCFSHRSDPDVHTQHPERDTSRHRGSIAELCFAYSSLGMFSSFI